MYIGYIQYAFSVHYRLNGGVEDVLISALETE